MVKGHEHEFNLLMVHSGLSRLENNKGVNLIGIQVSQNFTLCLSLGDFYRQKIAPNLIKLKNLGSLNVRYLQLE